MEASPMPPEFQRELEALRRRAYGLDADIDADPEALRRLGELESALHPRGASGIDPLRTTVISDAAPAVRSDTRHLVAERSVGPALLVADDEPEAPLGPVRKPSAQHPDRRLPSSVRATAIAVTAIVALGWVASMLSTPRSDLVLTATQSTQQERQDLIDQVDLVALGMVGAQLRAFTDFRELSVWSASSVSGMTCLLVQSADDGVLQMGCTPAPLQPSIDLRVGDQVGPEFVGGLPIGSVVRFTLRGGEVGVWTAEATVFPR